MQPTFLRQPPAWVPLLWGLERRRWWLFVLLGLLYLLAVNGLWRITADAALHVQLAQSLADGRGWTHPDGVQEKVSPGLSLLLWLVGGERLGRDAADGWRVTLVWLVLSGTTLFLTYQVMFWHARRPTAVLVTLLLGLSAWFYELSFTVLTELPFTVGLMLMLLGHEWRRHREGHAGWAWTLILVGIALMALFRSVAAVVVGAYLLNELITAWTDPQAPVKRATAVGALVVAGLLGGLLYLLSPAVQDDAQLFVAHLQGLTVPGVLGNLQKLMHEAVPEAVFGQAMPGVLAWPTSLLVVFAGIGLWRERRLWGVLWAVMVVQWLVFLVDPRYLLPLLPITCFGLWRMIVAVALRLGQRRGAWWFALAMTGWVGANAVGIGRTIVEQRAEKFYATYRHGKYADAVRLGPWVEDHLAAGASLRDASNLSTTMELAALSHRHVVSAVRPADWVLSRHRQREAAVSLTLRSGAGYSRTYTLLPLEPAAPPLQPTGAQASGPGPEVTPADQPAPAPVD